MRRPSPLLRRGNEIDIESAMTPMIDVVFLLLVFFVWTASFQIIEQILPSEMSTQMGSEAVDVAEPPPEKDFEDIVVRISWNGTVPNWSINDQPVASLELVERQLKTISGIQPDAHVILHPHPTVPLGYVIETYDVAKVAGFAKIAFAVNPPGR